MNIRLKKRFIKPGSMLIGSMTKLKMGPSDWLFDIKD